MNNNVQVIKFWATWCSPCAALSPIINELKNEFMPKGVSFRDVDIDNEPEITQKYGVRSVPTVIIIRNGSEYGRITGVNPKKVISDAIQSAL